MCEEGSCREGCAGNVAQCAPYVCGANRDEHKRPTAFSQCRTSCAYDYECVAGFICKDGQCEPKKKPLPIVPSCRRNPAVCKEFSCNVDAGVCYEYCFTNSHCSAGYSCVFETLSSEELTPAYQVLGRSPSQYAALQVDLCESAQGPNSQPGRCVEVVVDPTLCNSQDSCGLYACGRNNLQRAFARDQCLQSCAVHAHCSKHAHCDFASATCQAGAPPSGGCANYDSDYCAPYACGSHLALEAPANAECRTFCEIDEHCAPLYRCDVYASKCVEGDIILAGAQLAQDIPAECFWLNGVEYREPLACLEVPIPKSVGYFAFILPFRPPAPQAPALPDTLCRSNPAICRPFVCGAAGKPASQLDMDAVCLSSCVSSDECVAGFACVKHGGLGQCVQARVVGASCDQDRECFSGHCVDGVCCNTACDSPCQKCSKLGVCGWVEAYTDARNDCGLCATCGYAENGGRECVPEVAGNDASRACGDYGKCNGARGCQCDNSAEFGFWEGQLCDRCKAGYFGEDCKHIDSTWREPPVRSGNSVDAALGYGQETLALQYATKVVDVSSQSRPGEVYNILGLPVSGIVPRMGHGYSSDAFTPKQITCERGARTEACINAEYDYSKQLGYVTLAFDEPVYIDRVLVWENFNPGSIVQIWSQRAQSGSHSIPGSATPITDLSKFATEGKVIESFPQRAPPLSFYDQSDYSPPKSFSENAPQSANDNLVEDFYLVWSRDFPSFPLDPVARVFTAQLEPLKMNVTYDNVTQEVRVKSNTIRIVFNASSQSLSQFEAVAIAGFAKEGRTECPGAVNVSSLPSGSLGSVAGYEYKAFCSGHGSCGPRGCTCFGNHAGEACEICKFGWSGVDCDQPWTDGLSGELDLEAVNICSIVAVENPLNFDEDELRIRWRFEHYKFLQSIAVPFRHFGTLVALPTMSLPVHTHVHIKATIFIVDMPNNDDSGVMVRISKRQWTSSTPRDYSERISDAEKFVFQQHIPYSQGVSLIGQGKADNWADIDVYVEWPFPTAAIELEIWSPDITDTVDGGDHRFTVTTFIAEACTFPGGVPALNEQQDPSLSFRPSE